MRIDDNGTIRDMTEDEVMQFEAMQNVDVTPPLEDRVENLEQTVEMLGGAV